jgi:ankyrin repeat protein
MNQRRLRSICTVAGVAFFSSMAATTVFAQADMPWTKVKCQVHQIRYEHSHLQTPTDARSRLMKSIQTCDYQTAFQLIESGINLNFEDPSGNTPLAMAVAFGQNSIIQDLLQREADPNRTNRNVSWGTALTGTALTHNVEGARLLLERGANVDMVDVYKATALMYAAEAGETEIVRLLLAHGADPRLRDKFGKTAMESAIETKHPEIAVLLDAVTEN